MPENTCFIIQNLCIKKTV